MRFGFSEEQEMIRSQAVDFLKNECPIELVRELMDTDNGHSRELWEKIVELGWTGLPFPEEHGGVGLSFVELCLILEEMGKHLVPGTYFSTVLLGGMTLLAAASDEQKSEWLQPLAEGSLQSTLGVFEPGSRLGPAGIQLEATRRGDSYLLQGTKLFVPDAAGADLILCAARTGDDGQPENGISLFAVDSRTDGLGIHPLVGMDPTRRLYALEFDAVQVPQSHLLGEEGKSWPVVQRILDLAIIGLSAEMVGGSQRVLDLSVSYAGERVQFNRPIGSFQAIQHKCADMLVQTESARSAVYAAAWFAAEQSPDLSLHASIAKAYTSDAYSFVAGEGVQIHGGMGFTWEENLHLYLKRAKSCEAAYGDATYHRERIAGLVGL